MTGPDLQHVEAMRVGQTKIHLGDPRWYVQTANNWVVRGPYEDKDEAVRNLQEIRDYAYEEAREEAADD